MQVLRNEFARYHHLNEDAMIRLAVRATSLAVLLCCTFAFSIGAEKKFDKKFSVSTGGTLTIQTDCGSVDITGTSASEVTIAADIRGSQRDVDGFNITASQNSTGVEVKGKGRNSGWFKWSGDSPEVRFTIMVPREYSVKIYTAGGNIVATNLKGRIEGETSGGDLKIRDIEGSITLETSGGNIDAENLKGDVHMETSGGDIQLLTIDGNIDVGTSGGNIRISDVDGKIRAETSGGDVVVKAKNGNKGIYTETSGGNIDIFVPKNITATIDASTSGGEILCDLPVTMSGRLDESRIRGTVNGGGNTIHAYTSGGDVRIRAAD